MRARPLGQSGEINKTGGGENPQMSLAELGGKGHTVCKEENITTILKLWKICSDEAL